MNAAHYAVVLLVFLWTAVLPAQTPDQKLIENAKKEGEVVWYTTLTLDMSNEVMERFRSKHPFIKTTLYRKRGRSSFE